jgi:hypothetical protein
MANTDLNLEAVHFGATGAVIRSRHAFAARPSDRTAVAILVAILWIGVLSGFGTDMFDHVHKHGLDYPPILHVHALVFFGWLVLLTTQLLFVRASRIDLHMKLGFVGAGMALLMMALGPVTALAMAARHFASEGTPPFFLAVQFVTITSFAVLTLSALLLRKKPAAHKRLMLLGTIFLCTPGFVRFMNGLAVEHFALGLPHMFVQVYFSTDSLILAMGAYDLVARRRLHPAYLAGVLWCISAQALAVALLMSPAWRALSFHLIGH